MFEDAATASLDASTNGNDLAWSGSVAQSGTHVEGSYSAGDTATEYSLQRTYDSLSANFPFKAATGAFTIGGWVYLKGNFGTYSSILRLGDLSNRGFNIGCGSAAGKLWCQFWFSAGNRSEIIADNVISSDGWHHVIARWNGDNRAGAGADDELSLWIDGTKQTTTKTRTSYALAISGDVLEFHFSATTNTNVDEWCAFDVALTDTEIGSLYDHGLAGARNLGTSTTYSASLMIEPHQLFVDTSKATLGSGADALSDGQWFWGTDVLYYESVAGNPDTLGLAIEASVRASCINNSNYVENLTLRDLAVKYSNGHGISLQRADDAHPLSNFLIDGVDASWNTTDGMSCQMSDVVTQNSTFSYNGRYGFDYDRGDRRTVTDVVTHHNGTSGHTSGGTATASDTTTIVRLTTFDNGASGCVIYNSVNTLIDGLISYNHAAGNGFATNADLSQIQNLTLTNSLLYANHGGAVYLDGTGHGLDTVLLSRNVVVAGYYECLKILGGATGVLGYHNTLYSAQGKGVLVVTGTGTELTWKNNIGVTTTGTVVQVDASVGAQDHDYNAYLPASGTPFRFESTDYAFADWKTASSQDAHSLNDDPLLVNAGGTTEADYYLTSLSPCRNAGVVIAGINDGYSGAAPDIGFYEYTAVPDAPTGLTATATGPTSEGLSWTAPADTATPPSPATRSRWNRPRVAAGRCTRRTRARRQRLQAPRG